MATNPPSAPEKAPANPAVAPAEKITLDAKDKLADLKSKLEIKTDDPAKQKEIAKIEEFFKQKKDKILTISKASLNSLQKDINDPDEVITGKIEVKDGELVHTEAQIPEAPAEQTPPTPEIADNLSPLEKVNIPENVQEEMAKYSPKPGNIGKFVQDFILNFMAGFAPDWVAKVRGFGNATLEKKADAGYNTLVGDEGRSLLEGSPLSNILILDHIDKNDFKKILAEYPTLDFSNKTHIEAAFLGKHANNENLTKYHRIYQGMGEMQTELSNPESMGYNPEERLKRLLSYSRQEDMEIEKYEPTIPITPQQEQVPMNSSSPEVQKELMTQATELDEALTKARAMPEGTTEEKAVKEEAIKKAQEVVTKFKEERKNTILKEYNSIKDRIKEGDIERATLIQRNSPEESEKKKLGEVNNALIKLRTVESSMRTKIDEVMTQSGEKWEVKNEAITQSMISVEIAIGTIENNTVSVNGKENEDRKLEGYGKILTSDKIISDGEIGKIEAYLEEDPNPDLQEKFEIMKAKIELVKMAVRKKNEMKEKDRFINWNNASENSREGWVEVEPEYSGGTYNEEKSWLELDANGFGEVDWQLVRGDNYFVKKVGGLKEARKILNTNKEIIKKSDTYKQLKV